MRAASLTLYPPYGGLRATREIKRNGVRYETYLHETLADYFSTIGLRIVRGRAYTPAEVTSRARSIPLASSSTLQIREPRINPFLDKFVELRRFGENLFGLGFCRDV